MDKLNKQDIPNVLLQEDSRGRTGVQLAMRSSDLKLFHIHFYTPFTMALALPTSHLVHWPYCGHAPIITLTVKAIP